MNALRIHKRLDAPVPGFPELTPLVGRTVEIIVLEETGEPGLGPPISQRARVAGRVGVDGEDGSFPVALDTGDTLHAQWAGYSPSPVPAMAGQRVTLDGVATFAADGTLRHLRLDGASPARPADDFFSRPPECVGCRLADSDVHQPQSPPAGMAQAFGARPGDEGDEEVLRALEEVE